MPANVQTMAYFGATPWHSLGNPISEEDSRSIPRTVEKADMGWLVGTRPAYAHDAMGNLRNIPAQEVYRVDTDFCLGVVGPRFTPLQNIDAFKFFQPFLDTGECKFNTAGVLDEGRRVWVLAEIIKDAVIEIVKDDAIQNYILLSNSHDGTLAVRAGFTRIRVVCANTMAAAHADKASKLLRVKHTKGLAVNLEKIRDVMNLAAQDFNATAEQYRFLASRQINRADLRKYVKIVLGVDLKTPDSELKTRTKNTLDKVFNLFDFGRGQDIPGVHGTYWAAYNAVTEYLSYDYGRSADSRLNSLWFGPSLQTNRLAIDKALELATAA